MILSLWLGLILLWLFFFGAAVGSFLNVCIFRLSLGKSLIWPPSSCGHCFQPVRLYDNIPLLSYWILLGRCRVCRTKFSPRYFFVELFTAVVFVSLYLLEVVCNAPHIVPWDHPLSFFEMAQTPPDSWSLYVFHVTLACFLIVALGTRLEFGKIPPAVTITATLVGLIGALCFPWPFPMETNQALALPHALPYHRVVQADAGVRGPMPVDQSWADASVNPRPGIYAWPVWGPLPDWLPARSSLLGLATGLAGALVGGWGMRLIGFLLGLGLRRPIHVSDSANLMTFAGAFLGWQPILAGLVLALVPAGLFALARIVIRRSPPVELSLTLGIVAAWLGWAWVGPLLRPLFFAPVLLPLAVVLGLAILYCLALLARIWRSHPKPEPLPDAIS
jgi:leader peptidase (prepilin peptidase)/N-methyltransferase